MNAVEHLIATQDQAGETPIWVPNQQALYCIDHEGACVHRYEPATGQRRDWALDVPVTALARRTAGGWILATKTGLVFWDEETNASEFIVDPMADNKALQFNDSAVDRQGRLLVGTGNVVQFDAPDGVLYRLDADLTLHIIDEGYAIANGIGVSPDGATIYVTDMFNSRIIALDYDTVAGTVSNRRTFVDVPTEAGWPDGLIVDAEGFIWSAHWAGSRITRYDPDGKIEREVALPVSNVTCMGFGGADLNELYITTAWFLLSDDERASQPQAGDVFRLKTDIQGIIEPEFAG